MRKVKCEVASSLDNFIASGDGSVDWLMWTDEAVPAMHEFWKTVDTILMGRKTYEFAMKQQKGGGEDDSGISTYVFSRTMKETGNKGAELVSENAAEFVRALKAGKGGDICLMGGGDFAKTLFEAGLVDEIGLNIHPVLLGKGIPLFLEMDRQVDLELIDCKPFKNGCVAATYRVKN